MSLLLLFNRGASISAQVVMPITFGASTGGAPTIQPGISLPAADVLIGFVGPPLDPLASLSDVSSYLRGFTTTRGRSFEFDRFETGTCSLLLSNRDSRFNPENVSSPYYPNLLPTRRIKIRAVWDGVVYPVFSGFTEGYPQRFPGGGEDATVELQAADFFYPINRLKFPTGTALPEQSSGERIAASLDLAGIDSSDRDLDTGQSTIAATDPVDENGVGPLDGQAILEHCLLVAEAENGRFFSARDGKLTFRDRDYVRRQLTPSGTFGGGAGYVYDRIPQLTHEESKLYNRIRITLPDGQVVEAVDTGSISQHFERTLDKSWPLADAIEVQASANYLLGTLKNMQLRIEEVNFSPIRDPATLWPVLLGVEIGQRWNFELIPPGGGTTVDEDVVVDGISHRVEPGNWRIGFRLTLADSRAFWRLGVPGFSELATTTRLGY